MFRKAVHSPVEAVGSADVLAMYLPGGAQHILVIRLAFTDCL